MSTVCGNECNACYACHDICPQKAITIEDNISEYRAVIDQEKCIHCNLCKTVCTHINEPELRKPIKWYQGWALDSDIRRKGSSGGIASAIVKHCIDNGFYTCSCVFSKGEFLFLCTNKNSDAEKYSGSKYVKSKPEGIYETIQSLLKCGEKVLFIGLPCQCAALKNYVHKKYLTELYTIDLICHGAPSPKVLDLAICGCGLDAEKLTDFSFRSGSSFKLSTNTDVATNIKLNMYLLGFLKGDYYSKCCYSCKYANLSRVSDITLGDSWGTELKDELKLGLSLALVQTEKGDNLLQKANVELRDVDLIKAVDKNEQLRKPSEKKSTTDLFYRLIKSTHSFYLAFFAVEKMVFMKQILKIMFYKIGIYKPETHTK